MYGSTPPPPRWFTYPLRAVIEYILFKSPSICDTYKQNAQNMRIGKFNWYFKQNSFNCLKYPSLSMSRRKQIKGDHHLSFYIKTPHRHQKLKPIKGQTSISICVSFPAAVQIACEQALCLAFPSPHPARLKACSQATVQSYFWKLITAAVGKLTHMLIDDWPFMGFFLVTMRSLTTGQYKMVEDFGIIVKINLNTDKIRRPPSFPTRPCP